MTYTIVVCVLGWLAGWAVMGRPRSVAGLSHDGAGRRGLEGVSVVIPARDEERSIAALLTGLCDPQDPTPAPDRIIVVDDHSTDRTTEIAASFPQVEVLSAPALPERWTGKSWACHVGTSHARSANADSTGTTENATADQHVPGGAAHVVAFLDADVRLDRASLATVVAERDRAGGLVSVQPWHQTERAYEQLSCLFNVIAVMGTAIGSQRGATGAFGPVMVTSLADYDAVGGHDAVRSEVVEDLALAERYRNSGRAVEVLEGGSAIRFRMYPGGIRQLVDGWAKNFATGAGSTRRWRLAAIVGWVTALGTAAFALDDGLRGELDPLLGVGLYLAFAAQLWWMFRQVGSFGPLTATLFPIPLVGFIVVFLRSLWLTHVRHAVTWRGRSVSTAPDRG
ncbi:MAG: glycosyltransferase [Microthrixaceae bacterium]